MTYAISQTETAQQAGLLEKWCRPLVLSYLSNIRHGCIELIEQHQEQVFGDAHADLRARLEVLDNRFYSKLLLEGSVGAGEAYMDGWWKTDQLTALVRIFARNSALLDKLGFRGAGLPHRRITNGQETHCTQRIRDVRRRL